MKKKQLVAKQDHIRKTKIQLELKPNQVFSVLYDALSALLFWHEPFEMSKAIVVKHPTKKNQFIAVHSDYQGTYLLEGKEFDEFINLFLCDSCKKKIDEYSIIHTGQNIMNGEFPDDAFVGLEDGHDEDGEIEENPVDEVKTRTLSSFIPKDRVLH